MAMRIRNVYKCEKCEHIGLVTDDLIQDSNPDVATCPECGGDAFIVQPVTAEILKQMEFTGIARGKYFEGFWLDNSEMNGYGIYHFSDGEIPAYGDFSDTGSPNDEKDAGDLIEAFREKEFEIVEGW